MTPIVAGPGRSRRPEPPTPADLVTGGRAVLVLVCVALVLVMAVAVARVAPWALVGVCSTRRSCSASSC